MAARSWRLLYPLPITLREAPLLFFCSRGRPHVKLPAFDAHNCDEDLARHDHLTIKKKGAHDTHVELTPSGLPLWYLQKTAFRLFCAPSIPRCFAHAKRRASDTPAREISCMTPHSSMLPLSNAAFSRRYSNGLEADDHVLDIQIDLSK